MSNLVIYLKAISDVITAGGAIIAFSLFIYVITFRLRDHVTRSFTFLLACIVVIFGSDAFVAAASKEVELLYILRIQYLGLILLPTAYFYFSDALLAMTGKPSKGKRRISGYISIVISVIFIILNLLGILFSKVNISSQPAPHIERTLSHDVFSVFFIVLMLLSWYNFIRSLNRTSTKTSRRRMIYLITSAVGPALGSFPYLLYGSTFASQNAVVFWILSIAAYSFVSITVIGMTYTVSFFGFPWPDRVIKSRLFRWIMRGPITASITLGVTTLISRIGKLTGDDVSAIRVLGMVASIIVFEYFVTIFAPILERLLFNGSEKDELEKIRTLENRLLTRNDLEQFLELLLATLCDRLQIKGAVIIENRDIDSSIKVKVGKVPSIQIKDKQDIITKIDENEKIISYKKLSIIPIHETENIEKNSLLGFIAIKNLDFDSLDEERIEAVYTLVDRAAAALLDRRQQDSLLASLEILTPQVSEIQSLLATSRFDRRKIIDNQKLPKASDFEKWVKDALNHYFGGPKLSQSPLIQLKTVQIKISDEEKSPITALREVLKDAISFLRPEGNRQYTNEWILFNILDLKFIEGWKVKDLARRLALSEADFYRKQRVAITAVAEQLASMDDKFS